MYLDDVTLTPATEPPSPFRVRICSEAVSPRLPSALTTVREAKQGFSTDKGDLPATAASNVPGPARQVAGLPKWRKAE
jgi:hypothetical protein